MLTYLQGRYLVPGLWGEAPIYENSRMVWFEEGMAQYLAASTRKEEVKALDPVREAVLNDAMVEDLSTVLSSSYSAGNSNAYYVYAPLLWSHWLANNDNLSHEFCDVIRHADVTSFDAMVSALIADAAADSLYRSFVDSLVTDDDAWFSPSTVALHYSDVDYATIDDLYSAFANSTPDLETGSILVTVDQDPRRFTMTKHMKKASVSGIPSEDLALLRSEANGFLEQLNMDSLNHFQYTTAYFDNVQLGDTIHYDLHIEGPLNDTCRARGTQELEAMIFEDFAILLEPAILGLDHQWRFRARDSLQWQELPAGNEPRDTAHNLLSLMGYEYQLRHQCAQDVWSPYSESRFFVLCPDVRNLSGEIIEQDIHLAAANVLNASSAIPHGVDVTFSAGQEIFLDEEFTINRGGVFQAILTTCRTGQ